MTPDEKWKEARERMEKYIHAVLWQDLGVPDPEIKTSVDWILDEIFRAEYIGALNDSWELWRQDDNGNHFKVKAELSHNEAKALQKEYENKGHKQFYWILPENGK